MKLGMHLKKVSIKHKDGSLKVERKSDNNDSDSNMDDNISSM